MTTNHMTGLMTMILLTGAWAVSAQAADEKKGPVPHDPAKWIRSDDYPAEAVRNRYQGVTGVAATVGPEGKVEKCEVIKSSGQAVLDEATCNLVRLRGTYDPAIDKRGRPVRATHEIRYAWKLPTGGSATDAFPRAALTSVTQFSFSLPATGQVANCRVDVSTAAGNVHSAACPDSFAQLIAQRLRLSGADGKSVRYIIVHDVSQQGLLAALAEPADWQTIARQTGSYMTDVHGVAGHCDLGTGEGLAIALPPICQQAIGKHFEPLTDDKGTAVAQKIFLGHVVLVSTATP